MKLSNLVYLGETGSPFLERKMFATVDVETGFLFWKKKETRKICKKDVFWFFLDSGKLTPGRNVERLEIVYFAKKANEDLLQKSKGEYNE